MFAYRRLHLLRRNVASSANDDLFLAPREPIISVRVAAGEVSGVKPAAAQGRSRSVRILPVPGHQVRTLNANFPNLSEPDVAILRIEQPKIDTFGSLAKRSDAYPARTVPSHRAHIDGYCDASRLQAAKVTKSEFRAVHQV